MSEPDKDLAAMFAASTQAKQFERGQTVEGTIVAIGLCQEICCAKPKSARGWGGRVG